MEEREGRQIERGDRGRPDRQRRLSRRRGDERLGTESERLPRATFDPKTGTVHFEAQAKGRRGQELHYKVDGKLAKNTRPRRQ
jgi:hypothetical protein